MDTCVLRRPSVFLMESINMAFYQKGNMQNVCFPYEISNTITVVFDNFIKYCNLLSTGKNLFNIFLLNFTKYSAYQLIKDSTFDDVRVLYVNQSAI